MSDDGVEVHSLRGELGISSNENLDSSTAPIYHDAPEVSPASITSDRPLPQPKKPSKFGLSRFMMKQKKATGITQEATETGDPATTRPAVPRKSSQLLNKLYKDKPYPEVTAQQWLESLEKSVAPQLHAPKPRRTMQNWFDSNTDEELESCQLPANVERSVYRSPIMNETTLPGLPRDHEASEDESFLSELRRLEIQTQAKRKAILSSSLGPQTKSQGLFDSRVLKASASQQSPPSAVNRPSQLTGLGLIPNPFEADSSGLSTPTSMLERAAASSMIVVDRAQLGRIQTPGSARAIFDMVRPEELVKSNDPDPPERKVYRLGNVVASQNTRQPSPLTVDLGGSLRGSWISDSAFTDSSSEEIFTKPNVTTPPEPTPTPTPKKPSYAKSKWRQSRHIMTVTREEAALILDLRRRRAAGQKDATLSGIGSIENGWPWAESLKKPRSKRSTGKSPRGPRMGLSVSSRPRKVVHLKPHTTMAYYQSDERFTATSSPLAASRTAELEASSPVSSVPPTPAVPTSYMDTAVATPRQFAPYTRQRNSTACPYKLLTEVDISRLRMSVMLLKSDRFEEIPKRYGVDVHLPEAGEQGVDTRVTTAQSAGAQGMTVPVTTTQEATTQSTATQGASTHGATAPSVASPKVDNWQPWREELRLVTAELEA